MKTDLDALMKEKNLDAVLITGPALHNPSVTYFTGRVHMTNAEIIKKQGNTPVVFYNPMERDEAAKTGMEIKNLAEYRYNDLLKEMEGDMAKASALRYKKMLADVGVTSGRIAIYGKIEARIAYSVFNALQEMMPEIEIVGETVSPVLRKAMETKDDEEVERIRQMGQVTVKIVDQVAKFLQSHKAKDGVLIKGDGQPLKISEVKRQINLWAIENGVENPHDCIFAIGHDAGVPHSAGNPDDHLHLGKTIIFDIFLQEPGGGYHYDFTRTWCLGHAPEAEQKLYDDVRAVFEDIMGGLEANAPFAGLQDRTCELFEAQGHPTIRQDPLSQKGYVHGLGHGLGLELHEEPFARGEEAKLKPGVVVTIEPGLYYPEDEMGVRLEDTIFVHQDGTIEILAEYSHDLVLPISE